MKKRIGLPRHLTGGVILSRALPILSELPSHPESEVAAAVDLAAAGLSDLLVLVENAAALGAAAALSAADAEALYNTAKRLCDDGQFDYALPIALRLTVHDGKDGRYAYMAGACFQFTGRHDLAGAMYGAALLEQPEDIKALFRLAECYAEQGQSQLAGEAFEQVIELGRTNPDYQRLQEIAQEKLSSTH